MKPPRRKVVDQPEPEHFQPAWLAYPGHEVMRRDLALAEFRLLTEAKQRLCRAAVPDYANSLARYGKKKPMDFHMRVRTRGFDGFPDAKLPEEKPPAPVRRFIQGDELAGLMVAVRMGERRELRPVIDQQLGHGICTFAPQQADLLAMAAFVDQSLDDWSFVEQGCGQFGAWRDRLELWLRIKVEPERIWTEPFDRAVHGLPAIHPDFKLRKAKFGLRVPAPWPPLRDGRWSRAGESE